MKNLTPQEFKCIVGSCPQVYELDDMTLLVIGKKSTELPADVKIAKDEQAITISRELVKKSLE
ncbi:MAG: hypothetical protein GF365_03530 [Candidatus Buchananbacteria bacterium]|nr:hypothetical protein [Candidatus Buchananbacteria bacterium]